MKKYISFILVLSLLLCLSACKKMPKGDGNSAEVSTVEDVVCFDEDKSTVSQTEIASKQEVVHSEENITSDEDSKKRQSTVIAPKAVIFYKAGMQSVSTDKELNYKIARHIEDWYKDAGDEGVSCLCRSTDADVLRIKNNETAIELEFDKEFKFYGGHVSSKTRKIFIPLTGEKDYVIFAGSTAYGGWSHYYPNGKGLEAFFEGREFEPIPNERWQSTIIAPDRIQLYRNGELLEEHTDQDFNLKVAQYVESWYLYETSIDSTKNDAYIDVVKKIRANDTYVEIFFYGEIKIYGESLLSPETHCLLIPLSGEGAGCVFEAGNDYNYKTAHTPKNAQKMDHFFASLNDDKG